MTPMKAIREKCLDCCAGQKGEIRLCTCTHCPLYNFRMGKNESYKRELTEEQREAYRERAKQNLKRKN